MSRTANHPTRHQRQVKESHSGECNIEITEARRVIVSQVNMQNIGWGQTAVVVSQPVTSSGGETGVFERFGIVIALQMGLPSAAQHPDCATAVFGRSVFTDKPSMEFLR